MAEWLSIEAYSKLQGLSIPIIQSRIKDGEIDCRWKNGRWLLKVPEKDKLSAKEIEQYYSELLKEKEQEILQLKEEREDMLSLLALLEQEKRLTERQLFQSQGKSQK